MSAYEQGFDLFKQQPDLTLGEVAWLGPKTLNEAIDFLEGYKAARRQHDDYKRGTAGMKWSFDDLEPHRIRKGRHASPPFATFGAFELQGPCGERLTILAVDGRETGWEHVSVSTRRRIPNWREMCFVKNLFWGDDEWVVQFHPAAADYVNNYSLVLHLWKYTRAEFPTPPGWTVGYKELGTLA